LKKIGTSALTRCSLNSVFRAKYLFKFLITKNFDNISKVVLNIKKDGVLKSPSIALNNVYLQIIKFEFDT